MFEKEQIKKAALAALKAAVVAFVTVILKK
jgi:hypothetical protein